MVKNMPAKQKTWARTLGSGRCPGEGKGNPLQYSCLGYPIDRGAWRAAIHVVSRSRTPEYTRAHTHK